MGEATSIDELERNLFQEDRRIRFQKLGRRRVQAQIRPISISRVLQSMDQKGVYLKIWKREAQISVLTSREIPCILSS